MNTFTEEDGEEDRYNVNNLISQRVGHSMSRYKP